MGLFTLTMLLVFHSLIRNGFGCATNAEDCSEIKLQNQSAASGVYEIKLAMGPCNGVHGGSHKNGNCCVIVYCDMDRYGGGWTVFQKRYDGSVNFKQNWTEYESGFGSVAGEFYAGNKFLNMLTSRHKYKYELLVELDQYREKCRLFARYSDFQIGNASTNYSLTFGSYLNGTAGDSLTVNFTPFSTYDNDNDNSNESCAQKHKGAWWYTKCHISNLNGEYPETKTGCVEEYATTMIWYRARGYYYSFKGTEMKLRPAGYKLHTPQLNHWLCLEDYEFLACPDDCQWCEWGEWSHCGSSPGRRTRSRQVGKPASKSHVECRGPRSQAVECFPESNVLQTSDCTDSTPSDCSEIKQGENAAKSAVYLIKLADSPCNDDNKMKNAKTEYGKCCVAVYCDMTRFGGGWTIFQKRFNDQQDFNRNWAEYEAGFGSLTNEFYAGNQFLYHFTQGKEEYELLVELYMNDEKCSLYAHYASFSITNPKNYSAKVGRYLNGTAGDGLRKSIHKKPFSTYDRDNDNSSTSCAKRYKGGWWYGACFWVNLNGKYRAGCHRLHDANENENSTLCPSNFEIYPCPNDCHWALWTSWSECTPLGDKVRTRGSIAPLNYTWRYAKCFGPKNETKSCYKDIDECESKPCLHGGTCVDKENSYNCGCVPGEFNGTHCQNDINTCRSSPCLNGATCKNGMNRFSCLCADGYTGLRCDKDIDECESKPCLHGGTCVDKENSYKCGCVPGEFNGTHCQNDINTCRSSPCLNGATCKNGVNRFSCLCADGYTGLRCDKDIDECLSNPCVNGGTCQDKINRFTCTCVAGYTGNQCEEDIHECFSNPCVHGGTCQDKINSFNCTCVPGYTGNQCETDINECASNPCNNGATCIDKVNNFTCNCAKLYVGSLCETDCHWTTWSKAETCHKEGKNCVRQLTRTSKSDVLLCKPSKKDTETTEKCDKMDCHRMSSTERIITAVLQSIGCIWLLALIAVTFVTCLVFKARNLERLLHACEEIVLFIGHLFILFLREATWSHTICMITSIGLQYTMISLFVFFVLEALQQYAYLTNVQVTGNFLSCRTNLVVGFGLPLVITTISAAFWAKDYPAEWSCWLNLGHTLSAGSIVPLLFCSLLTIIILEAATMGHYEALLGVDKRKRLLAKVNHKALLFILPITIAHWITGMYSVYEQYISMYTIVFGLNIALGVLIFIFHGLTHGAVNKYFLKLWRKGRNIVEKVVDETPKANADTSGNAPVVNEVEDLFKWAMNGTLADKKRAKEILFGIKADPLPSHEAISSTPQQPLIVLQPEPKPAPVISEADKAEAQSLFKWAMNSTMADKNQAKQLLFGATISPHSIND